MDAKSSRGISRGCRNTASHDLGRRQASRNLRSSLKPRVLKVSRFSLRTCTNQSLPINTQSTQRLDAAYLITNFQLQSKQPSEFLNHRSGVRTSPVLPVFHHSSSSCRG